MMHIIALVANQNTPLSIFMRLMPHYVALNFLDVMMCSIVFLANQNIPLSISNRCTSSGRSPKHQLHKAFTAASILQKTNTNTILHQKYTRHVLKVSSAVVITYKAFSRIHAALQ